MKLFHRKKVHHTDHIEIFPPRCIACWNCVEACKNGVLGKIDIPFHKHVRIEHAENCTGCLKCIKACQEEAIHINRREKAMV